MHTLHRTMLVMNHAWEKKVLETTMAAINDHVSKKGTRNRRTIFQHKNILVHKLRGTRRLEEHATK